MRSHGEWHTKCYSTSNHTKTELENICKKLGFRSGHAKQLQIPDNRLYSHTKIVLDKFSEVVLNSNTSIMLKNNDKPLAKIVFNEKTEDCHPLFIECL